MRRRMLDKNLHRKDQTQQLQIVFSRKRKVFFSNARLSSGKIASNMRRKYFQRIEPAASIATLLTSKISWCGIGDSPEFTIEFKNALEQASCPLSCCQRECLRKPGQLKPRSLRKLSSCKVRPPTNTSILSFGKEFPPLAK